MRRAFEVRRTGWLLEGQVTLQAASLSYAGGPGEKFSPVSDWRGAGVGNIAALAQTAGGYDLTWWTVDGGGGTVSGGGYALMGTALT